MAYVIEWQARIKWVGDGTGQMGVPSAQMLQVSTLLNNDTGDGTSNGVYVPGGDSPTSANITTACATVGTNMASLFNASLPQIQGFATGGG
jgi:hypothetical protein